MLRTQPPEEAPLLLPPLDEALPLPELLPDAEPLLEPLPLPLDELLLPLPELLPEDVPSVTGVLQAASANAEIKPRNVRPMRYGTTGERA